MLAIEPCILIRRALSCLFLLLVVVPTEAVSDVIRFKEKWNFVGFQEEWMKSNGFSVGRACGWNAEIPPESNIFSVKRRKESQLVADANSIEFRGVKPKIGNDTEGNYFGSNFVIDVDKEAQRVTAVRITQYGTRNGLCSLIIMTSDDSEIELIRGDHAPQAPLSRRILSKVDSEINKCRKELDLAANPQDVFYCTFSRSLPEDAQIPSEGPYELIGPEGVVPAFLARLYLRKGGQDFAVTVFNNLVEIEVLEK